MEEPTTERGSQSNTKTLKGVIFFSTIQIPPYIHVQANCDMAVYMERVCTFATQLKKVFLSNLTYSKLWFQIT